MSNDTMDQDMKTKGQYNHQVSCNDTMIHQMEKDSLTCDVVQDLLPLYHDGAVSEKTHQEVEHHLKNCESCWNEYEILCTEFPIDNACNNNTCDSTKEEFDKFIKKQKRKQYMISSIIILIACTLFVILFYVADRVSIIPVKSDEIQLEDVSRYWTKEGYRFAIPYDCMYNDSKPEAQVVTSEEQTGLEITFKRTLFAYKHESYSWQHQVWASDYDLSTYGGEGIDPEEIDFVEYDGKIIWDAEQNGDEPVPIAYTNEDRYRKESGEINIKGKNSVSIVYFNTSLFALIFGAIAWGIPFFGLILSKKKRENIVFPVMISYIMTALCMIFQIGGLYASVLKQDLSSVEDTVRARLFVAVILLVGTTALNIVGYVFYERRK